MDAKIKNVIHSRYISGMIYDDYAKNKREYCKKTVHLTIKQLATKYRLAK
jgi:hypothetical protein